jgi:hypothetical protein
MYIHTLHVNLGSAKIFCPTSRPSRGPSVPALVRNDVLGEFVSLCYYIRSRCVAEEHAEIRGL